jgi:hypothetical protein
MLPMRYHAARIATICVAKFMLPPSRWKYVP